MEWFRTLLFSEGIAHTILLYSLAIWLGVLLGKVKIVGISLGPTFVLFVGLFIGHLGFTVNHEVAEFVREFGLILFIYSIGLQVGPGFFSSFKRGGMQLNLMAAGIVLLGVGVTILLFLSVERPGFDAHAGGCNVGSSYQHSRSGSRPGSFETGL